MLEDLKLNKIKEAVIRNSRLYFLSSSIFQTDFSELSLPTMTNLLKYFITNEGRAMFLFILGYRSVWVQSYQRPL
jgi:hypothetical protein